jgi:PPK2 family polyphosphate:nucleotide phosphotransferase
MIKLADYPTTALASLTKKEVKEATLALVERLGELQHLIYASGKHSVLIVLQGMDASGKDGAVRNVFAECTISGMQLVSFKKPTEEEFAHDFLWRVHKVAPQKGMFTIYNRSHYEDILIQRVHNWIDDTRRDRRMKSINAFEELLKYDNNTHIFKFYMHISKEEQEIQLQQRIDDPTKRWKHNDGDWQERKHWDEYVDAYEYAINQSVIPWYICPVDDRWYRDYFIVKTLVDYFEQLDLAYPAVEVAQPK